MLRESDTERLSELIAEVLRGKKPMSEQRIAGAIYRLAHVRTDAATVRLVLLEHRHRFVCVKVRLKFLRRAMRWRLVEAGPASDSGTAGAPVPSRPRRPLLSGAAAAALTFRDDDPPTRAISRPV